MNNDFPYSRKHFVLLVGINDYPAPVSKLGGCIRDINRVEKFLKEKFGEESERSAALENPALVVNTSGQLNICRLENQTATYNNIVDGFRQFLGQAKKNDVVWFHFSGHGTEMYCAEEFLEIEPNGKDQSLVCYHKSEADGQPFLADKELAILIHELTKGEQEPPHIVVSTDCCHSGSITRDEYITRQYRDSLASSRSNAGAGLIRKLDTYLDGIYAKQWEENQTLEIPSARHVAITACENIELASELPEGGLFTQGLMDTLELTRGNVSYADLFVQARSVMRRNRRKLRIHRKQNPQFFTYKNFDPHDSFLKSNTGEGRVQRASITVPSDRYRLKEDGGWYIMCGIIHGIPADFDEPIQLEIFESAYNDKIHGHGELVYTGAIKSEIEPEEGLDLDPDETYYATIRHLPAPPQFIKLSGNEIGQKRIERSWSNMNHILIAKEEADEEVAIAEIESIENDDFLMYDHNIGKRVLISKDVMDLKRAIKKIFKWHRFANLVNDNSMISNWVDFEMGITLKNNKKEFYEGKELVFYASEENFFSQRDAFFAFFAPQIKIKNFTETLYIYLFHLRANYEIKCIGNDEVFRPEEYEGKTEVTIPLIKKKWAWGISANESETECCFKLLILPEPLDYIQLQQDKIDGNRPLTLLKPLGMENEWFEKSIKVKLIREIDEKNTENEIVINNQLKILKSGSIDAKMSISAATKGAYSKNPLVKFFDLNFDGFQLIDFKEFNDISSKNILELTNLTHNPNSSLKITITKPLTENQKIIPVMFDGNDFIIAGETEFQDGNTIVKITHFPDLPYHNDDPQAMMDNPFIKGDKQHISLYRSLKIGFFLSENGVVPSVIKEPIL